MKGFFNKWKKKPTEPADPEFLFYLAILKREEKFKVKFSKQLKEIRHSLPATSCFRDLQI